jgi:hypothetical protein
VNWNILIMFLHEELKIAFLAEPKHGTEATRDELYKRGFIRVGDHHDNPDDLGARRLVDIGNGRIWVGMWNEIRFFSTVRHPGEVVLSWAWRGLDKGRYKVIDIPCIQDILWNRNRAHFPQTNRFWRHAWISPRLTTLRYETLREDLDELFKTFGLDPLPKFPINPKYMTKGKPRDGWYNYWTDEAIEWFNNQFETDLQRFNYRLQRPPLRR